MKNELFAVLFLLLVPSFILAQRIVTLSYQEDAKGNIQFSCYNKAFCNEVIEVDVPGLKNASPDHPLPYIVMVKPGLTKLFQLIKTSPGADIQFTYKLDYHKGCIDPTVDTGFTYLLPISPGKTTQVYELSNRAAPGHAASGTKDWYAIRCRAKPGDTIFAARRGIVTEVDAGSNLNDSGSNAIDNEDYTDNFIEIVQGDCSFAQYGVIKKDGAFVKPGQQVEAGQPIGLVGGDRFGRGADIRLSVSYNQTGSAGDHISSLGDIYANYVRLEFWTKKNGRGILRHGGIYTSEFPKALLTKEKPKAGAGHTSHGGHH